MGNVEIPKWLKSLPLAPEFRPTDTEFADPIAYISKIEKEVGAFGICKVIPPLPKPSKKYVFNNLNKSLLRTSELGLDLNVGEVGDLSKKPVQEKRHDGFRESRAVFTTRQQELGQASKRSRAVVDAPQPAAQKQVWQSGEYYTLEQFELKSKVFSKSVLGVVNDVTPLVIEALFWKASLEKPIYIEYANDVPGSGFGKPESLLRYFQAPRKRRRIGRSYWQPEGGDVARNVRTQVDFEGLNSCPSIELRMEHIDSPSSSSNKMSHSNEVEGSAGWKLSNCPWNLQVIARSAGSLTRFMLDDIPGVTSPMVYVGMLFSWFAWHVEDHELHSLNFLHTGSPKTWYAVPGEYAFAFEDVIRTKAYGGDVDHLAALKILGEKTTLLSPETVVASGIPCCRLVQNPGEFVVTFPRAYHVGFSHGFNCGEAANFGTPQWLILAKEAAVRRAAMDLLPMLSHQQLLYLLTMSFLSRVPSTQFPCVRTSRLRNRLKEERELLVKQAFIEDVLKENCLLNALLGKDPAFRAILWHPDSLPSLNRDSLSHTGTTPDTVLSKEDDLSVQPQKGSNQDIHHLSSSKQPLNDTYFESNDLLCDFQVDSGTLVCVACGILGYPIMSVIQPSNKASIEMLYAKNKSKTKAVDIPHQPEICPIKYGSKNSLPDTLDDETWNTSVLLRPRFFCLEHAVQIVELLRPKGGAKVLVICHSDYQKIKANAVAVAEELKTTFTYKEAQLDSASSEELKLIDFAIDEQLSDLQEDWTSKLGINLKFSVKTRKGCFSKSANHALDIDYLLSTMAPSSKISNIRWSSKKLRTKRESNRRTVTKFRDSNLTKDGKIHLSDCVDKKEKVLLQYFRRKYKSRSKIFTRRKIASGCSMACLAEVIDAIDGKIDGVNEQDTSRICCSKDEETASKEFGTSPENCVVQEEVETLEANRELTSSKTSGAVVIAKALASASGDSNLPRVSGVIQESYKTNGDPDAENCSSSLASVTTTFDMTENLGDTETCECHSLSTCTESTTAVKVDVPNFNRTDKDRRKRRQAELQSEAQNSFVKSPCEGLRPRRNKQDSVDTLKRNVPEMAGKFSTTKKLKKATESSILGNRVPANKTAYGCSREGCRMRFTTRAQQTLHKRNQCHHKDCGKRFKSHKYVLLHQRVHDDERPLKCTWTGCTMSFKWAWARTEHLRLHTGARPYSCKFKGCDRTFRFVSDFSRHRRKFGHYTNLATK